MASKKQNQEPVEVAEEVTSAFEQEPKKEEPKKIQNEGKSLFSAKKEGGTRAY